MTVPLLTPTHLWNCPNCKRTDMTHEARPHTRYHACAGLRGLSAPFIPAGTRANITAIEREDYIGSETAGRFMAVRTERPDGSNDVAVFAPTAQAGVRAL